MADKPEAILEGKKRPFTGAEYLESLRDGREVYIYGERVKDVTTHPAFRNAAASVAKLYDAMHDPKTKEVLTAPTDTGSGGYTHKFFKAARSREDVIAQRDAIAAWARITYGWMGRSPDYKAAFLNTLGANAEFYGQVRRQRARLAQARPGGRALSQPRPRQPAHRPRQARRAGQGRLHHHPEGDRRRHLRLRRQGGGHQLGAHPLQLPRPEHGPGDQRPGHGGDVHRPHEHAGHQALLPRLLRACRRRHRLALGLPAHLPLRRERRHLRVRQRLHPLGERDHPPRRGAAEAVLPALGLRQRLHLAGHARASPSSSTSSPACSSRPRAPRAWRPSAACRRRSAR